MIVRINGQQEEIPANTSLLQLLQSKGIPLDAVVVEYNYGILPREQWDQVILQAGDNLEVLHFVGGG